MPGIRFSRAMQAQAAGTEAAALECRYLLVRRLGAPQRELKHPNSMRKLVITSPPPSTPASQENWLALDSVSRVEITSEDNAYPIESAFLSGENQGWRAATPGTQTIRLIFDEPQTLRRIWLVFEEHEKDRTQEFALRWSPDGGHSFQEIVRQQWNFSSRGSMREVEDYTLDISPVSVIELIIVPDISRGGEVRASLLSLRLAGSKSSR